MIVRYYLDTSIFCGYFDSQYEVDTHQLFYKIFNENIRILYSELTENELENAPETIKSFIRELPKDNVEYIEITKESIELADRYISENIVSKTNRNDCIHIALAVLNRADLLISWDFKHTVNLKNIRGYNSVNLKNGYPNIEIRSPKEIIDYENNN